MSRKKISTTIYVTPEQNEQLKLLHARTKVPIAVFIREGIDLVLSKNAHLLPGQLQLSAQSSQMNGAASPTPDSRPVPPPSGSSERSSAAAGERSK
jgi:hypothetical protein